MKPANAANMIVFSDLDGTLLDHETYSYAEADNALALLRERRIPLILASSKTAAEIFPLRQTLGFQHCEAIVENGAGLLAPGNPDGNAATDYEQILDLLSDLPNDVRAGFTGFSDWSAQEVADRTGLSVQNSELAKQRYFSEPGLWSGNDQAFDAFSYQLQEKGLVVQQGGRFISLSFGGNKAGQMLEIQKRYHRANQRAYSIALGDAGNDIAMLEAADLGVIIPNPDHKGIPRLDGEASGSIIRAVAPGPRGWNETIKTLLANNE
ncbi:mannosyl-3-phosphoglycerate phosphatase [Pararhizobium sp. IMCC21322]|uniref:HAD-IIB family hydrolase n=1 Tax=Pararhizobium sp. IMCC21322 TaxID=3067903 RepID=UPI00274086FA|nr:HAD-IIB family hydrolase [Pararhizobium sp. IMCC21322]